MGAKEEEELKKLKDKQAKRKEIRSEQEKKLAQQKKEEEERLRKDEADKKAAEAEEKRKKMEEAEKKRQEIMKAQKEKMGPAGGSKGGSKKQGEGMGNVVDVRREMTKTKEQLEEEKKISLSIRIRPLELDGMDQDDLKSKAKELWDLIVRLETERYDLEERTRRQDYDLKELKERQRQQNKQKAIKLGLDPEALTGKYPPKIRMYSKYERRTDTRSYTTGRRCTREAGKLSKLNTLRPPGRRSTTSGARDPPRSCPSGSVRGPARRLELPRHLRVRRRLRPPLLRRRIMMRRKKRRSTMRRRNKLFTTTDKVQVLTSSCMICLVPTFPILTGFVKTFIINMVCTVHSVIIISTVSITCTG